MENIFVSFVHGYNNINISIPEKKHPALWLITEEHEKIYHYYFPRNVSDFMLHKNLIAGPLPDEKIPDYKKLPRFGLTGIAHQGDFLFAGAWNGVYMINKKNMELQKIISNKLMNDLHGIHVENDEIYSILTCKDTIVISDFDGNVKSHFTIDTNLQVYTDDHLQNIDWRFISKQFRGSAGKWHFNYIQKIGNELWLTTRSANCFVIVDLVTKTARLRLMNLPTPTLLHDGMQEDEKFYFTSVDGKIIVAQDAKKARCNQQEGSMLDAFELFNMDLVADILRLEETNFQREPNWCRGIDTTEQYIYTTVDGRYDTELSFALVKIDKDFSTKKCDCITRLQWAQVAPESEIRYVTGFDIHVER